ncbi:MAG: hypothetical protein U0835_07295 [Isosphaeraceae bacterium]
MTHLRPYLNRDSPALARLWNRGATSSAVARPLTVYEFDSQVLGGPHFDPAGLIVAERENAVVGFVHAGFGPDHPPGRPLELVHALGTVGMLVVDPQQNDASLPARLFAAAEEYLRSRGASVFYAGGQFPLNPYYWGVYGGSEWAGILSGDATFRAVVEAAAIVR